MNISHATTCKLIRILIGHKIIREIVITNLTEFSARSLQLTKKFKETKHNLIVHDKKQNNSYLSTYTKFIIIV